MPVVNRLLRFASHYQIGVRQIDQQHEEMVERLNALNAAFVAGAPRAVLAENMQRLLAAVTVHFRTEEDLMRRRRYPSAESHAAEHARLLAQVTEFQKEFEAGTAHLSESMMSFLKDWLRNHMLVSDKSMGAYLASQGSR